MQSMQGLGHNLAFMIGSFERSLHGLFIYQIAHAHRLNYPYAIYHAQTMTHLGMLPKTLNIWSDQLTIWLLAKGIILYT